MGIKYPDNLQSKSTKVRNRTGAKQFPKDIEKYIKKVLSYGAVLCPFESIPFDGKLILSPLNSVLTADSTERRIVMDLNYSIY